MCRNRKRLLLALAAIRPRCVVSHLVTRGTDLGLRPPAFKATRAYQKKKEKKAADAEEKTMDSFNTATLRPCGGLTGYLCRYYWQQNEAHQFPAASNDDNRQPPPPLRPCRHNGFRVALVKIPQAKIQKNVLEGLHLIWQP